MKTNMSPFFKPPSLDESVVCIHLFHDKSIVFEDGRLVDIGASVSIVAGIGQFFVLGPYVRVRTLYVKLSLYRAGR